MLVVLVVLVAVVVAAGIQLAESAVKVRPGKRLAGFGDELAEPVEIQARDGIRLRAWFFAPVSGNGEGVLLLHGFTSSSRGMLDHIKLYLDNGYAVLAPDSRGHGSSGGTVVSFGIREVEDLRGWVEWLCRRLGVERVYGHGQSMGAGVLLQSLEGETRWRAVVAESSFTGFREIAYERIAGRARVKPWIARTLLWPVGECGLLYAHWRYGVNLRRARPIEAVRRTRTPVLLIHGGEDQSIPDRHSRELHRANPGATELWIVPGAKHETCLATAGQEYERRVMAFLKQAGAGTNPRSAP